MLPSHWETAIDIVNECLHIGMACLTLSLLVTGWALSPALTDGWFTLPMCDEVEAAGADSSLPNNSTKACAATLA